MLTDGSALILVIVGPTAAGKSTLAVKLAEHFAGEIVSADSMQVYRRFDIGTGKLPLEERRGVPHHLIDIAEPDEDFSAARFTDAADKAIAEISSRGCLPIVVGGTGLYVKALLHGLFVAPTVDPVIRQRHRLSYEQFGNEELRRTLVMVDPAAAERIHPNDFVRTSRALEVFEQTGTTISAFQAGHQFQSRRYDALQLGMELAPAELRQRIERRVDAMLAAGWIDEVKGLLSAGYAHTNPMRSLGYRQLREYLEERLAFESAVSEAKQQTWRFSRRQMNWFRSEKDAQWIAPGQPLDSIVTDIRRRLKNRMI